MQLFKKQTGLRLNQPPWASYSKSICIKRLVVLTRVSKVMGSLVITYFM